MVCLATCKAIKTLFSIPAPSLAAPAEIKYFLTQTLGRDLAVLLLDLYADGATALASASNFDAIRPCMSQ